MALRASIYHIELAMEGKTDFVKKTNPFGGGDDALSEKHKPTPKLEPKSKEKVTSGLKGFMRGMKQFKGRS